MEDAFTAPPHGSPVQAFNRIAMFPRTAIRRVVLRALRPLTLVISTAYRRLRDDLVTAPKVWVITGVAGFIGSSLLKELLGLGQHVIGIDNFSTGHRANLDEVVDGAMQESASFRMIEGDIRDLDTCRAACQGADYVLHHAALGSVPWSVDDPLRTNAVNVDGFINMLIAAKDAGVRRFVYASSSAVYGDTPAYPQIEHTVGRPLSPYAASKAANETYALAFQMSYGLETIGLRYFNVFGPRQDPAGAYAAVIPKWTATLLRGERCRIFGDGETTRDFCFVGNVVQANLLAASVNDKGATCQTYNIACGESVSLNQLFALIRDNLAVHRPDLAAATPLYAGARLGDIRYSRATIDKARELLSFAPSHSVGSGLKETFDWYVARQRDAEALATSRRDERAVMTSHRHSWNHAMIATP
jgi:UDP-N-acetylglucosamine/UDP-N-acetylgalactosamine 4-epimerase